MSPNDPRTFFEFLLTLQLFLRGLRGPALDKNGPDVDLYGNFFPNFYLLHKLTNNNVPLKRNLF